ncbi:MAG: site-2 protease family protein [Candidatus Saganbacteria bacterium]|nr:site-2 protease family protein [Candidatus Saganbacteria bacterium]
MKTTFQIFKAYHIPVEINYSWFIIFALVLISLARGYFPVATPELPTMLHWILSIVSTIALFACLLIHELSHSYVAIKNGLPIHSITLFVFGGVAQMEKEPTTPKVEFEMAAAGPLASLILALFFFTANALCTMWGISPAITAILSYLAILNLIIVIFNLVPGFPLDGGRILRSIVWHFTNDFKRATHTASAFGKFFGFLIMGFGLINLLLGSLITGIWFIFIGFFLLEAADMSYKQVLIKNTLAGVRVGDIMTKNVITVPEDISLSKIVDDYFFRFRFSGFPVVSKDDKLLGIITIHNIKAVPRENWGETKVFEHMTMLREDLLAHENMSIVASIPKMANNGLGRLLIIKDHKLIGILSDRDVNSLFEFKNNLGS